MERKNADKCLNLINQAYSSRLEYLKNTFFNHLVPLWAKCLSKSLRITIILPITLTACNIFLHMTRMHTIHTCTHILSLRIMGPRSWSSTVQCYNEQKDNLVQAVNITIIRHETLMYCGMGVARQHSRLGRTATRSGSPAATERPGK